MVSNSVGLALAEGALAAAVAVFGLDPGHKFALRSSSPVSPRLVSTDWGLFVPGVGVTDSRV